MTACAARSIRAMITPMTASSAIRIGPHTFTVTDARRTLSHAGDLFDVLAEGRDATVIELLRAEALDAIDGLDPLHAPTEDLDAPLRAFWQAWTAAGPALRAAGELPATAAGTVTSLHTSSGGVPKLPHDAVEVDFGGVIGDRQGTRLHHGRPWQALCLWSTEVIDGFVADGHGLFPGAAGENITITGLRWDDIRPGVTLAVGEVRCEISSYAVPCKKNAAWFVDGAFDLMHRRHGPVSRVYATVLEPGRITAGDPAVLEP
jgi:MOSC domain-containing protein YiiM